MVIEGTCLAGGLAVKFVAHRDGNDVWRIETRDPYQKIVEAETSAASPYGLLETMLGNAIDGCRNRVPERAPRPALQRRQVDVTEIKPSRLGPRRRTSEGDTAA